MAAFNHRRFLVSACKGLIGANMPVALAPAGEEVKTGTVIESFANGWHVAMGGEIVSIPTVDLFGDFSKMSGRLRGSIWLVRALEKRFGVKLPVGSLGPSWANGTAPGDPRWTLSAPGWRFEFYGRRQPEERASMRVEGLLDLENYPFHTLPDGTAEVDAIALKLACEAVGVGA